MHASWSIVPDFEYCNYAIYFGASKGHSAGHASCSNMGKAAEARARGMKMVVVDPMCNFAAAKATEWVPLRVGTDAALALAMCNVMVNELGHLSTVLTSSQDQRALSDRTGQALRPPSREQAAAGMGHQDEHRPPLHRRRGRRYGARRRFTVDGVRLPPVIPLSARPSA